MPQFDDWIFEYQSQLPANYDPNEIYEEDYDWKSEDWLEDYERENREINEIEYEGED